jgi:superfamily II DNA or RNA helicase
MIVLDSVLRVPQSDVTDKILSKFTVTRRYGEPFPLWEEKEDHFTFPVGAYGQYFFKEGFGQLRDLRVKGRLLEETESLLVPREGQAEAVQTVVDCFGSSLWPDQGLLVAGCGKGKTIMGTEIARRMRRPTCILVHKEYLGEQWAEAIEILVPKASIGYVRQDRCDTGNDHDFVIASTQSITSATRVYSSEFYDSFGVMLFDEVHRYGANVWHQVLQKFPAKYRLGLTATAKRFDGLWPVITSHLGEVYHELDSDPMTFKVYTLEIKSGISRKAFNFDWMDDKMRRAKIISLIAKHDFRNTVIARNLKKAYDASRNVIIISDRKEQLKTLMMKCQELGASSDDMGLFVGGMKKKDRDRAVSNPLIFTTYGMSQEGLDIERLDALFLASPRAHIEQTVGRILRQFEGKNMPVVVDPVDVDIDEAKGWAYSRLKEYEALGAEVEGNFRR